MAKKSNRPLNNFELVEQFLENALDYDFHFANNYDIIPKIVSTELNIENFDESLITKNSKSYRLFEFRKDSQRIELQKNIVLELLSNQRLDSDEEIEFGKGGAFPKTELKLTQDAYILVGLPASGKSGIANIVADKFGCLILDSDYAKRKLPEFDKLPFGATLVHEESDYIIFGENKPNTFKSVFDYCIENGSNMVLPKIGHNSESILDLVKILKKKSYKVHLTLIELDRVIATKRALNRFKESGRYVPLCLIFDTYNNSPSLAFYRIVTFFANELESYGIISTAGTQPIKQFSNNFFNPANLFK